MNRFHEAFPEQGKPDSPGSGIGARAAQWPPVAGEYVVLRGNRSCHVAVSTLASAALTEEIARLAPNDLCIVGKTETENIGIDKIIQNTITNPSIHALIVAGREPEGHRSGATLLALCEKGVDEKMRVIGSPGRRPVLKNVSRQEVEAFRSQVRVIDMIGCEDAGAIAEKVRDLAGNMHLSCGTTTIASTVKPLAPKLAEVVQAEETTAPELDRKGYFVILPLPERGIISVEHYANDNTLLRRIEGKDARSLYHTIIRNGWVSQLSHAAYLGKELERAALSMKLAFPYRQDGF